MGFVAGYLSGRLYQVQKKRAMMSLLYGVVGRGDRVGHLRSAVVVWSCASASDDATGLRGREQSALISATFLTNSREFYFHALG
jgi:hypothetical protein